MDPQAEIRLHPADISTRDNRELAEAGGEVAAIAASLFAQGLIDEREYLRMVYRFLGENLPKEEQGLRESAGKSIGEEWSE